MLAKFHKQELKRRKIIKNREERTYKKLARRVAKSIAINYEYLRCDYDKANYGSVSLIRCDELPYDVYKLWDIKYKFLKLDYSKLERLIEETLKKFGYENPKVSSYKDHTPGSLYYYLCIHCEF